MLAGRVLAGGALLAALSGLVLAAAGAAPALIALSIADIRTPAFAARGIRAELTDGRALRLGIAEVTLQGRTWRGVTLRCARFTLGVVALSCDDGALELGGETVAARLSYENGRLDLTLEPAAGERWRLTGDFGAPRWQLGLAVHAGQLTRLAAWFPEGLPRPTAGRLDASVALEGQGESLRQVVAKARLEGLAFADATGLRAGERVAGELAFDAAEARGRWSWNARAAWREGEVYWQPLFLAGAGQSLALGGSADAAVLRVERGELAWPGIGAAQFAATLERGSLRVVDGAVETGELELAALYRNLARPFLQKTILAEAELSGRGSAAARFHDGALAALELRLAGAGLRDPLGRFALEGLDGVLPWRRDAAATAEIAFRGAALLGVPLGPMRVPLVTHGFSFFLPQVALPVLDGALSIEEFQGHLEGREWQWRFRGGLTPVSVERLTRALGVTPMHGTLSAVIPRVRYERSTLEVDGALLFRVFDGSVVVKGLTVTEPLGLAPRLAADIDMSGLDLDLLTRTFSFGSMQGRVDVGVQGLELAGWRPVAFDARVASSPGDYPRRISQRAVQDISSLGGASAAAAIQASFLRFFQTFGYAKIGLSCRLVNGVCRMGGVEDAGGGYVIVKGGGIPALTVMGYNRAVGWEELLARLERAIAGEAAPVIE